ncbi:amino acid permease [Dactylosporangium sp. NPDC000521]|uniref:amino acid permease n=1 Tax=Dactylosporangium sp. NPDC000521 TaxID=3363975 RepID=UPI003689A18E
MVIKSVRRSLGVTGLAMILISASGPMTVLVGGLVTTFAVSGNVATPLAYPVVAAVLAVFSVGYATMSRLVRSAGGFYPYVALGLGSGWGVTTAFVAVLAYSAVQIGLFGLFGVVTRDFAAVHLHLTWPWWTWSALALVVVALLGIRKIDLNAKVLAVLLVLEIAAVVLFDAGALSRPADGAITLAGLSPDEFLRPGVGVVFAFAITGYLGFEQGAVYSEEARDPRGTVARATYVALAVTGVLYTVTGWAMTVGAGPDTVVQQARDSAGLLPFAIIGGAFGGSAATAANALIVTSVFACMLSIHNAVARYVFAMSRDGLLPGRLVLTGRRLAAPVIGSMAQSAASALTVVVFAVLGLDPVLTMFTWLSYFGALGLLVLLAVTSAAVIGFFRRHPASGRRRRWRTRYAPALAMAGLVPVVAVTMARAETVLGVAGGSPAGWVLIGMLAATVAGGALFAAAFRHAKPEAYAGLGTDALLEHAGASMVVVDGPVPPPARPAPRPGGAWRPLRWLRAFITVGRLWPLWRRVQAALPQVALLPRYRGLAALRSLARHAPLAAVRMPVEILDAYAVLAAWVPQEALAVAQAEAARLYATEADRPLHVEAALLAVALRARTEASAGQPTRPVAAILTTDLTPAATVSHLVRIGHALRRSRVVRATLRSVPVQAEREPIEVR